MNGELNDIRDIRPPIAFPVDFSLYLFLIILVVIGGLIAAWWFFKKKQAQVKIKDVAPKLPWIVAYERLEELKVMDLPAKRRFKEYYTRLSDIARRYMEDRFQIRAPEMTTEEFLQSLQRTQDLTGEQKGLLRDFLNACDVVKFAKYDPAGKEIEESFLGCKRLIDETKLSADSPHGVN